MPMPTQLRALQFRDLWWHIDVRIARKTSQSTRNTPLNGNILLNVTPYTRYRCESHRELYSSAVRRRRRGAPEVQVRVSV